MSKKTVENVCKWVSIVLVVISMLMLFKGAITISNKDTRKEAQKSIRSAAKEMDFDKEDIEELQDELDDWDIDLDARKLYRQFKKAINIVKDVAIAPSEIASAGPTIVSLAHEITEQDLPLFYSYMLEEVMEEIETLQSGLILLIALFYISLIVYIIVVILHITDNKLPGVSPAICSLIWLVLMCVASGKINSYLYDELDYDDKMVGITAAPVWGVILALAAMLIWMFKDKIAESLSSGVAVPMMPVSNVQTANVAAPSGKVCSNCGKQLSEGALFCTGCGTKFEVVEPVKEESSASAFCSKCGAKFEPDAAFCTSCGTPRE